eukprot:1139837-Pelagomonas_calceolata.AAC.3
METRKQLVPAGTLQGLVSLEPSGRAVLLASRVSASSPIDPDSYIHSLPAAATDGLQSCN